MLITIDRHRLRRADRFRGNKENSFDDDTNKPVFFAVWLFKYLKNMGGWRAF